MRFHAILNRDSGTLRTLDLDRFVENMHATLTAAGHRLDARIIEGSEVGDELERAVKSRSVDVILIGGGDGTISSAAAAVSDTDKILAVLPAGTMNLFARSLGVPLDLAQAVSAFATGEARQVDVATANGQIFVHQYSVGLHAKLVKARDGMSFGSKVGKIWASIRAASSALLNPPSMKVELSLDDAEAVLVRTAGIGITNNMFGEGHLPYADDPAGGVLGIYVASPGSRWEIFKLAANVMMGRWERNPHIEVRQARKVRVRYMRLRTRHRCVIDGELSKIERDVTLEIRPQVLRVLTPSQPVDGTVSLTESAASR
ncbi:MAG: diacylglycerol kinase family protein [Mesorhizobium sp.]